MTIYVHAEDLLRYSNEPTPLKSNWPFQKYPWLTDYRDHKVVCHPILHRVVDTLRIGEHVLLVGKPSTGKTLSARKVAVDLLSQFSIRFYNASDLYDQQGMLTYEFGQLLQEWCKRKLPMLGVVEDIHRAGFWASEFLNQVHEQPITWLLTSRRPMPLVDAVKIDIRIDRDWLRDVVGKYSELMRQHSLPPLPEDAVVDELYGMASPDLRALHYLVETVLRKGTVQPSSFRLQILEYLAEAYLRVERGPVLLRLCAIGQFDVDCDSRFLPSSIRSELIGEALAERVQSAEEIECLRVDPEFARWGLEAADKFGVGGLHPGERGKFVYEALRSYVSDWRKGSSNLLRRLGARDSELLRKILSDREVFARLCSHIETCPVPILLYLQQFLSQEAKRQLASLPQMPSPERYLSQSLVGLFGARLVQFCQTLEGRQVVEKLRLDVVKSKLEDSRYLLVYAQVFTALAWIIHEVSTACFKNRFGLTSGTYV